MMKMLIFAFFAGKGDGTIRFYEILPEEEPKSIVQHLGQFSSNNPTNAACAIPRRSCNVSETEIIRIYKVSQGSVLPLHFQVPRKSELFQEDIYPPARSDEAALSKADWFAGKNANPLTVSLDGGFVSAEKNVGGFQQAPEEKSNASPTDYKAAYEELKKKVAALEAEIERKDSVIAELQSK